MESFYLADLLHSAETPFYWVGALVTSLLSLWLLYKLITAIRIWVIGNGDLLSPKLGKWAGELVFELELFEFSPPTKGQYLSTV